MSTSQLLHTSWDSTGREKDFRGLRELGIVPGTKLQVIPFESIVEREAAIQGFDSGTYTHELLEIPDQVIIDKEATKYDEVTSTSIAVICPFTMEFTARLVVYKPDVKQLKDL